MNPQQCYRILGLKQGCSWHELRAAYRLQIKHWHPDRHQQQAQQHSLAEQRTQQLNDAFRELSTFHKQHGYLPFSPPAANQQPATASTRASGSSHVTDADLYQQNNAAPRQSAYGRNAFGLVIIVATAVFLYISLFIPPDPHHSSNPADSKNSTFIPPVAETPRSAGNSGEAGQPVMPSGTAHDVRDMPPPPVATRRQPDMAPASPQAEQNERFFTFGDPLGKVIEIQGVPSRTEGDIWYYGASEVHFNEGVVSAWYGAPSAPLKAR